MDRDEHGSEAAIPDARPKRQRAGAIQDASRASGVAEKARQRLIVPTMDVADWGRHQHELHARIAPVRAAEYGIPIFRVASSGISQGVDRSGWVRATAPFPGEDEMIFFGANLNRQGSWPLDRYLAPVAVLVTGVFVVWLAVASRKSRRS